MRSYLLGAFLFLAGMAPARAATKVACVGDSITVGVGGTTAGRYPTRLAQRLGAAYDVQNFGVSGTTLLKRGNLPYWNSPRFAASDAYAPDIVLIMLGTNDSKPANWAMSAAFDGDYKEMIAHYRALPSHPTVYAVLPPPAYGANPYMIRGPIIEMEVVPFTRRAAAASGAPTIDVFTALGNDRADFPDNVHPNDAGNEKIAAAIHKALTMVVAPDAAAPDALSDGQADAAADSPADSLIDGPLAPAEVSPDLVSDATTPTETAPAPVPDAGSPDRQTPASSGSGCSLTGRPPLLSDSGLLGLGALVLFVAGRGQGTRGRRRG